MKRETRPPPVPSLPCAPNERVLRSVNADKRPPAVTLHAAEQDRPDVAQRRAEWVLWRAGIDLRKLIFIDETWAKTNMTRSRGRAPRGEQLVAKVPHGHWMPAGNPRRSPASALEMSVGAALPMFPFPYNDSP